MKKVSHCYLLGYKVKVEHIDNLMEDNDYWGECDSDLQIIRIDAGLTGKKYHACLTHEKGHFLIEKSGLAELMTTDMQESICILIENL